MDFPVSSSPHLKPSSSVSSLMLQVLLALVPGLIAYVWFFGTGILVNITVALLAAYASEWLMLLLRRAEPKRFLSDWTAAVTAVLLALALPPGSPWWLTALGASFAMVFGKHLYGGLGYNPFNPAMVGYVVLLISFPLQMSQWSAPLSLNDCQSLLLNLQHCGADALSMATPLDYLRTELGRDASLNEVLADARYNQLAGAGWTWVSAGYLLGGLFLLWRGVIRWQIPLMVLLGVALPAIIFHQLNPAMYPGVLFHWFSGAVILGAFFIATDPVSAATTVRGRLWYGLGIGLLIWLIRSWGGYPDGVAFAVLLLNIAAPTLDHFCRPRVYGHGQQPPNRDSL